MEQAIVKNGKRSGWNDQESTLLWETADEAQQQGLPLKQVFERIAQRTGRKPNSIRNYYYAQVREREDGGAHTARFVPFTEPEVNELMEHVLRARARGQSVRSCLQKMAEGDHSLMLRYQNKYRSILKSRPELVRSITDKLNAEGIACLPPEVNRRSHASLTDACHQLNLSARRTGEAELIQACEVLSKVILAGGTSTPDERTTRMDRMGVRMDLYRIALTERAQKMKRMNDAAEELVALIKEYVSQARDERSATLEGFVHALTERIGSLEACMTEAEEMEAELATAL